MYKYNYDTDGIYVVVNGSQYRLEYDSFSVGTTSSKCAKCDFFKGGCHASESCRRIENQFPDSYWKLTSPAYVLCGGNSSTYSYAYADWQNELHPGCLSYEGNNSNDISKMKYTVGGDNSVNVDFSNVTITQGE